MRILMIAPQPFFEARGTPISVFQRLLAISKLGHEVDLVSYHLGKDVHIPGVRVYRIPKISLIKEVKIGPSWAKLVLDFVVFLKCLWMMMTKHYDVIHTHEEAAVFTILPALIFRKPHLYDMHSSLARQIEHSKYGKWRFLVKLFYVFEELVLHTCNAVITIGSDLQEHARKINPQSKPLLIENLPLNSLKEFYDENLVKEVKAKTNINGKLPIVYTGTFETYQGIDMLIESAAIVIKQNPQAFFILVGGKEKQIQKSKEIAKQCGLEDNILFAGSVSPEEALAYLDLAVILVSPRVEGLSIPLKVYSYLYSGKPFVATRIEAHTQVLNEKISVLVEPNREALAKGIIQVLSDATLRENLSIRSKAFADERFNFKEYTTKVKQIYQNLEVPELSLLQQKQVLEK
jgi:glycosyltransferase involved in cell wall biosynthesis